MNQNRRLLVFVLIATGILLAASIYAEISGTQLLSLHRISILSSITDKRAPYKDSAHIAHSITKTDTTSAAQPAGQPTAQLTGTVLDQYKIPRLITSFSDTSRPALPQLAARLNALRQSRKGKVRIAWLGDSMIEGDLITQTVRKRMQETYSGYGAGFVAVQSHVARFRQTVKHSWSGNWREEHFKTKNHKGPLFLSGHVFYPENGTLTLTDATRSDSNSAIHKYLICGYHAEAFTATVNGKPMQLKAPQVFNAILIDSSRSPAINIAINAPGLPVYGVSLESPNGVIIDNLSFRGVSGTELALIDTNILQSINSLKYYDLIVLEYGANLMYQPNATDQSWFEGKMRPVLKQLRRALPNTEIMLISTADRAFDYGGEWKTAIGIDNLLATQARLAQSSGIAFYNLYESMGGYGTIVRWADSSKPLANKDYIHPNHQGAAYIGNIIFESFMRDADK